jgi:Putative Zn-dependent protease, contains TPR repeats
LEAGEPNQAYHILNRVMPTREPAAYWLLAKAASEAGLGAEPQLALAEYHYLRGDLGAALAQLHQVLESSGASPARDRAGLGAQGRAAARARPAGERRLSRA